MTKKTDKHRSETLELREEHFKRIGTRLRELRTHTKISLADLNDELEFAALTVDRIERGAGGNIKSFISLLLYYAGKGYNLDWILLEDNSQLFKKEQNISLDMDLGLAESHLEEIQENAQALANIFKKIM